MDGTGLATRTACKCFLSVKRVGHSGRQWLTGLAVLVLLLAQGGATLAVGPRDYDVADGHYYEHGSPEAGHGFLVFDDREAPLWAEAQRLGGTPVLGYPISRRYACEDAVCQAFQRAVLRWTPDARDVELVNIFDELHHAEKDAWLEESWDVPPWTPAASASPKQQKKAAAKAEGEQGALIDAHPTIKSAYWQPGPLAPTVYGAARAYRATETQAVLRTQRAVLIQPSASMGQVMTVPAGAIYVEAGLVPSEALAPEPAPSPLDDTPPSRISVPDLNIDAAVISMDLGADGLLPVPDTGEVVAWYSYGARLGQEGNAILAGHLDWNRTRGAFWSLRDAQPGQTITLTSSGGRTYDYRVDWARAFPESSPEGLAALRYVAGRATITLVTCTGRFDAKTRSYEDRHIVRATRVAHRTVEAAP